MQAHVLMPFVDYFRGGWSLLNMSRVIRQD
jgi:hypothetical protein